MGYFPLQWKVAQIIMIPTPEKLLEKAISYGLLFPVMNIISVKAMLKRLCPILG
jgi:hypothetical protein